MGFHLSRLSEALNSPSAFGDGKTGAWSVLGRWDEWHSRKVLWCSSTLPLQNPFLYRMTPFIHVIVLPFTSFHYLLRMSSISRFNIPTNHSFCGCRLSSFGRSPINIFLLSTHLQCSLPDSAPSVNLSPSPKAPCIYVHTYSTTAVPSVTRLSVLRCMACADDS